MLILRLGLEDSRSQQQNPDNSKNGQRKEGDQEDRHSPLLLHYSHSELPDIPMTAVTRMCDKIEALDAACRLRFCNHLMFPGILESPPRVRKPTKYLFFFMAEQLFRGGAFECT